MNVRRMNGNTLEILSGDKVVISLSEEMIDDAMNIKVSGEILNEVAHDFEDEVMASFSVCKNVKIDLGEVNYIASLAMRALLSVQQIVDETDESSLTITRLSDEVKKVFEEAGFMDILSIEE